MMKRLDRSEIIFKILAYVLLTIFALVCLYPFVYILSGSLSAKNAVDSGEVVLWPVGFQIDTYVYVFQQKDFWLSYCNSFFITMYGTLVSMLVAITGAYALSKPRLMFGRGFNFMLVFTMWFNAGLIPNLNNFTNTFHVDNRYGFIVALGFNAFNIILLRNYFSGIPTEIEEAAIIDGANEFQILTKVYMPMSKSSIVTVAMFYAVARWNGYIWAQMILKSNDQPLTVYIRSQVEIIVKQIEEGGGRDFSTYALQYAFIVCSIIPVIVIYPKLQKYFAAGVNVGGVKE